MNWFWINAPLMMAFFGLWTGVPLWLTFRHPDTGTITATASTAADDVVVVAPLHSEGELVGAR
jgi:hypothetical protein